MIKVTLLQIEFKILHLSKRSFYRFVILALPSRKDHRSIYLSFFSTVLQLLLLLLIIVNIIDCLLLVSQSEMHLKNVISYWLFGAVLCVRLKKISSFCRKGYVPCSKPCSLQILKQWKNFLFLGYTLQSHLPVNSTVLRLFWETITFLCFPGSSFCFQNFTSFVFCSLNTWKIFPISCDSS
jgi:hypothetical protein